jgi:hypothetical protein
MNELTRANYEFGLKLVLKKALKINLRKKISVNGVYLATNRFGLSQLFGLWK